MNARRLLRSAATATLATGMLTAGAVAVASPASAVGSSACVHSTVPNDNFDHKRYAEAIGMPKAGVNGLNLRNGPGTGYTSLGQLSSTKSAMLITCTSSGDRWLYGKVTAGPNKGKWGWVSRTYTRLYVI
ncbi:SH3 domain-containing protein [Streptomyces noursei]|uniref:SH3 domain-containing protein n=1 Tax=Streptomyces noursei TaxID=1971 RepID=UPI0023B7C3C0|nr:SH3 domain-containing protein [Streptomyces noursei]